MSDERKESDSAPLLQIGEVARRAGVSIRTVRFYEEKGLCSPASCTSGGIRLYTVRDVNRLIVIKRLKMGGLSIGDIKLCLGAIGADSTRNARIERTIELLTLQKEKVEERISLLKGVKGEIEASLETVRGCLRCTAETCPESALTVSSFCRDATARSRLFAVLYPGRQLRVGHLVLAVVVLPPFFSHTSLTHRPLASIEESALSGKRQGASGYVQEGQRSQLPAPSAMMRG